MEPAASRNLTKVRQLLMRGDIETLELARQEEEADGNKVEDEHLNPMSFLLDLMKHGSAFDGVIAGAAAAITETGESERGSILSTARRNTKFLDSPAMKGTLSGTDFNPDWLKTAQGGATLYLCLPARRLASHARWLRLIINLILSRMEALGTETATGDHVLFVLDEFAVLGHMASVEKAAGLMAGFKVKLWPVLQDLTQLKRHYRDSWETFLGNAGLIQFFGNTDMTTLKYISERLGEVEVIRTSESTSSSSTTGVASMPELSKMASRENLGFFGLFAGTDANSQSTSTSTNRSQQIMRNPLMTPEEISRYFSRESEEFSDCAGWQIIFLSGLRPAALQRTNYDQDKMFKGRYVSIRQ